jgi:hypothetical protein
MFSDIQNQKKCARPKRDSPARKCIPDQVSDEVELEPEKKAQGIPNLYVPLRVLGVVLTFLGIYGALRMLYLLLI